jgi:hypothetical protein
LARLAIPLRAAHLQAQHFVNNKTGTPVCDPIFAQSLLSRSEFSNISRPSKYFAVSAQERRLAACSLKSSNRSSIKGKDQCMQASHLESADVVPKGIASNG